LIVSIFLQLVHVSFFFFSVTIIKYAVRLCDQGKLSAKFRLSWYFRTKMEWTRMAHLSWKVVSRTT